MYVSWNVVLHDTEKTSLVLVPLTCSQGVPDFILGCYIGYQDRRLKFFCGFSQTFYIIRGLVLDRVCCHFSPHFLLKFVITLSFHLTPDYVHIDVVNLRTEKQY
jgi:hypothetical protein